MLGRGFLHTGGFEIYICTYTWHVPWYSSTMVHVYVRAYVLIMLCHNFLIGKGHTCARRTTSVLGGYTAVRTYYVLRTYHGSWALVAGRYVRCDITLPLYSTYIRTYTYDVRTYTYVPWYHGTIPIGTPYHGTRVPWYVPMVHMYVHVDVPWYVMSQLPLWYVRTVMSQLSDWKRAHIVH